MPKNRLPAKRPRLLSGEQGVLAEHLAELRGRIRLLMWISGLCCTAMAVLGGMLVTGFLDWVFHFDDAGTRLLLGLALLGLSSWMAWRQLIAPLRLPLSSLFLAARVEGRFPGLKNRILSAVEFLEHQLDTKNGSPELQQAVVGQALDDLQRIEPADILESRGVRNLSLAGAFVSLVVATVAILHPLEAATSVQRLIFPFANVPWPRSVELKLVRADLTPIPYHPDQPLLIAEGETLDFYIINTRGRLPERVWFEYRKEGNDTLLREPLRQTTLRDEKGISQDAAIINRIATQGKLSFRASGGDDDVMPFYLLEAVTPPHVKSLQVIVTPPAYSRQPTMVLPFGVGHVQGLLGTRIDITGSADEPLKSARLRIGDQPAVLIPLDEDQHQWNVQFEIKEVAATHYWFELTGTHGFTDREAVRYELRGMADTVPEVSIETPMTDVLLTADAELPVSILAKDDLGLKSLRISYLVGDDEVVREIPLFDRESVRTDQTEPAILNESPAEISAPIGPQRQQVEHLWKMSAIDLPLTTGTRIVFRAEATDDYDLGLPHLGKSIPRTITIVSRDEKQKELAARVTDLLEELQKSSELQKRARQQTQELQTQLDKVGELRSEDVDQLHRAELDQRQAASRLLHPVDGVESQTRQLLKEFQENRVSDAATEQRLENVAGELSRLEREELPSAEQALTRAAKIAEEFTRQSSDRTSSPAAKSDPSATQKSPADLLEKPRSSLPGENSPAENSRVEPASAPDSGQDPDSAPDQSKPMPEDWANAENKPASVATSEPQPTSPAEKALKAALAEAQSQQTRSLETLTELQESLSEWRDRRDTTKDLNSVMTEQEKVQQEAAELAQQTQSKSAAELTPQERAELNKLAARQRRVADQVDQFRKQLDKTVESLKKNDPDSADKLNAVEQELQQQSTASDLQQAADHIAENQMGAAAAIQQAAMDELQEIERMMKRQPDQDTEQALKRTQESLEEFQQLRAEQENLADQFQQMNRDEDSQESQQQQQEELIGKQEELEERMAKAERKLEQLRLRGAADAAHRARKRLNQMMKNIQEEADGEDLQEAMDEALDDLEQVERELVLEKRIAQDRLAFEQLEKIADQLKSMRSRHENILNETERLADALLDRESFSRGQLKTLKDMAETERSLQFEAERMAEGMTTAEVFSLVLKRLGRSLKLVANSLEERNTSAATQALERDAIQKIDLLLTVLKQEQKKQDQQPEPPEKPESLASEPEEEPDKKPENAQPPGDLLPQLAQLKLLKSLQEEYLERTQRLDTFRDHQGNLPESMLAEKLELAREQAELADLTRNLISSTQQRQPDQDAGSAPADETHQPQLPNQE
jgi:hypothetical protein